MALYVDIVSPSGSIFKGDALSVTAPGVFGSFQVLKGHAPMIAAFSLGTLVVKSQDGHDIDFATSGGFLEVLNDTVTVLAETAEIAGKIDVERARAAEERALARLDASSSPEEKKRAATDLERARNRLRASMGSVGTRK